MIFLFYSLAIIVTLYTLLKLAILFFPEIRRLWKKANDIEVQEAESVVEDLQEKSQSYDKLTTTIQEIDIEKLEANKKTVQSLSE